MRVLYELLVRQPYSFLNSHVRMRCIFLSYSSAERQTKLQT